MRYLLYSYIFAQKAWLLVEYGGRNTVTEGLAEVLEETSMLPAKGVTYLLDIIIPSERDDEGEEFSLIRIYFPGEDNPPRNIFDITLQKVETCLVSALDTIMKKPIEYKEATADEVAHLSKLLAAKFL